MLLFVGVNGTGKTTTIGKLAQRLREHDHDVIVAAADTFRAAADEQLEVWAERAGADFVGAARGGDPAAVAYDAIEAAQSRGRDVVLVDTAGRLHTHTNLMAELAKIRRVIAAKLEGAPHETLLVVDATTGQNGLQQARLFQEAVEVSGVILTKLDGSARGGVAVAIAHELGLPVKLVGVGERPRGSPAVRPTRLRARVHLRGRGSSRARSRAARTVQKRDRKARAGSLAFRSRRPQSPLRVHRRGRAPHRCPRC